MSAKGQFVADKDDGLPALVVGDWTPEKLHRLERYIDSAREARRKFPIRTYVDLYCGPGRIQLRKTREILDGSSIAAWKISREKGVPFTSIFIGDADSERVTICERRLRALSAPVTSFGGEAEVTAALVVSRLERRGLHLAFLDPYNLGALSFQVIETLASLKHMDLIAHFSTQDLTRNLVTYLRDRDPRLEKFAPGWEKAVNVRKSSESIRFDFMTYWISCVERLGLKCAPELPLITNDRKRPLYRLALFSRNPLALKLWKDASRLTKQGNLF